MVTFNFTQYKPINVVVRTATPVDEFHFDSCVPAHVGEKAVVVSNPLYVMFNAQRLQSLGDFPLQEWINSMNSVKSDPLNELRKQVSDDDLISLMKSRYCQSPCELAQWTAYLSQNMDKLSAEVQEYAMAQELSKESSPDKNVVEQSKSE